VNGSILVENIVKINQLLSWYRWLVHKESVGYISYCYRNVITALESIYPVELTSVNYSISHDDEREFFTKHLPIRDWGIKGDLYDLKSDFHVPNVRELETAIDFAKQSIDESFKFLTENVLNNKNENPLSTLSSKEERNRELNYVNHVVYAASRLLKRPSDCKIITTNPDSGVEIGVPDKINKGLGFDLESMHDPNHEYSKLSEKHRNILFNLRKEVIEFIIKLAEKCMQYYSNETSLLMLIGRVRIFFQLKYVLLLFSQICKF
jgi:hypothetical protein